MKTENAKTIAWLNGNSVAVGSPEHVTAEARAIFETARWQEWHCKPTEFRITTYGRQRLLHREEWSPLRLNEKTED